MRIAPEPRSRPAVGCGNRMQLCLSQPFRQSGEPRAYGDWLAAVPSGICAPVRKRASSPRGFRRMVQELSTSAGYSVRLNNSI